MENKTREDSNLSQEETVTVVNSEQNEKQQRREEAERSIRVDDKPVVALGQGAAVFAIICFLAGIAFFGIQAFVTLMAANFIGAIVFTALAIVMIVLIGMVKSQGPNEATIYTFAGNYIGTYNKPGLYFIPIPLLTSYKVSLAQKNFESETLKINDERGNPLSVSAVVVYRVDRPASAIFSVDNYERYLSVQTEGALRHVVSQFPYFSSKEDKKSLLKDLEFVNNELLDEITHAASIAGIEIVEARINNISYSVEIAQSMLQRQSAEAVLDARSLLVEGSVGIVQEAVDKLEENGSVFTNSEKAAITSNLLTVLVGEKSAQPVVNLQ